VRAAKVITVSSDTDADGAAASDRAATATGRRVPKADKNGGTTPPPSIVPHDWHHRHHRRRASANRQPQRRKPLS